MTMNTQQRAMRRRTLVKTIKIEDEDMTLAGMADALDELVCDEMAHIEDDGGEIVGAVSISQARAVTTDYPEGSYSGRTTTEKGLIATITYRINVAVDRKATD